MSGGIGSAAEYEGDLRRRVEGAGIGTTPPRGRGVAGAIDTAAGSGGE